MFLFCRSFLKDSILLKYFNKSYAACFRLKFRRYRRSKRRKAVRVAHAL